MKFRIPCAAILSAVLAISSSVVSAHPNTGFISIPATGFTPRDATGFYKTPWNSGITIEQSYTGNDSGTARFFYNSVIPLFAPVNLPHNSNVLYIQCGGGSKNLGSVRFKLIRNEPQIANVEMAVMATSEGQTGFEFVSASNIVEPFVDNSVYNYYILALAPEPLSNSWVGFCKIKYTFSPILSF